MVKICGMQFHSEIGCPSVNLQKLKECCKFAAMNNAQLIVTPELFITGYNMQSLQTVRTLASVLCTVVCVCVCVCVC